MDQHLYPHAALGFRVWRVTDHELLPLREDQPGWQPGINLAVCSAKKHQAPGDKCHCGFNAYHDLSDAYRHAWGSLEAGYDLFRHYLQDQTILIGAIAGSGQLRVHAKGFRSEKAQVLALSLVREDQPLRQRAEAAARHHQVQMLDDPTDLSQFAELPGLASIADQVRPRRRFWHR